MYFICQYVCWCITCKSYWIIYVRILQLCHRHRQQNCSVFSIIAAFILYYTIAPVVGCLWAIYWGSVSHHCVNVNEELYWSVVKADWNGAEWVDECSPFTVSFWWCAKRCIHDLHVLDIQRCIIITAQIWVVQYLVSCRIPSMTMLQM